MIAPKLNSSAWNRLVINGVALPGIIQKITLSGSLVIDSENVTGTSNGVLIVNADYGEDISTFELTVLESELSRVGEFRAKYKGNAGERPKFVLVDHPLLKEFGIQKTILEKVEVNWDNSMKNSLPITVTLRHNNLKRGASTAAQPGSSGIPQSDEITNQPVPSNPTPPSIPTAER